MARKVKAVVKAKKKKWVPITAPKMFLEQVIGESYVDEPEMVLGKKVKVNLMNITRDPKTQNINLTFYADKMKKDSVGTEVVKYEILTSSLKRYVRRGKDRVDDSFLITTSDGVKLRVKPFVTTRSVTKKSVSNAIRNKLKEFFAATMKKTDYYTFVKEVVYHKFQKSMKDSLQKIYPIATCEIKKFEVVGNLKDIKITEKPQKKTEDKKPEVKKETENKDSSSESKTQEEPAEEKKEE